MRDQAEGNVAEDEQRYLSGFHAAKFFYPGPAGYDAAFEIKLAEIPELADIKYKAPIEVHISGSALVYELDERKPLVGKPVRKPAATNEPPSPMEKPSCA